MLKAPGGRRGENTAAAAAAAAAWAYSRCEGVELGGNVIDRWSPYFLTQASGREPWVFLTNPNGETDAPA